MSDSTKMRETIGSNRESEHLRLLIVTDGPLLKIGSDYYSTRSWVRFPQHLSGYCEQVTLWSPVAVLGNGTSAPEDAWRVELGGLKIEHNDYYESYVQYFRNWPSRALARRRQADRLVESHDAVVVRTPSPMLPTVASAARRHRKPLIVMMAGNMRTQSDKIIANSGLKRLFYLLLVNFFVRQETNDAKRAAMVYAYSSELADRFNSTNVPLRIIRTPHLTLDDLVSRTDTCDLDEIRLLRVCWLIPSKGLESLLGTVALLSDKGRKVRLEIVGKERYPGYQTRLETLAEELHIRDKVMFTGWVPYDRIGEAYVRNDIQVISSLAEGTPRSIAEGALRGLPLVSTTAGGCADGLDHEINALLVPPGDSEAMAAAVERIIVNDSLRRNLIEGGYEMARASTFEHLGMQVLGEISGIVYSSSGIMDGGGRA